MFLIIWGNICIMAESDTADVIISYKNEFDETTGIMLINASVDIKDTTLINDDIKFSYHVEDEYGNYLQFENERYELNFVDGNVKLSLYINQNDLFSKLGTDMVIISFDLVDEINRYWFSQNSNINIQSENLVCTRLVDASITVTGDTKDNIYYGKANISFSDPKYMNEELKFSYHVLDEDGNILQFENERYSISSDSLESEIEFSINIKEICYNLNTSKIVLQFDIVDEKNSFWYWMSHINFSATKLFLNYEKQNNDNFIQSDNNFSKVIISCDKTETYLYDIDTILSIKFDDLSLYNEGVKLSYRVYDKNMNIISQENERFAFELSDTNSAQLNLHIDLLKCGVKNGNDAIIVFDIVDEKNIYWFAESNNVTLETATIKCSYNFIKNLVNVPLNVIKKQPVQLGINIVAVIFLFILIMNLRKSLSGN